MRNKILLLLIFTVQGIRSTAQSCDCEKEFRYIKDFMEHNYSGFADKEMMMTKAGYEKLSGDFIQYSKSKHAGEECLLIILEFIEHFKDQHLSVTANFDALKTDSSFISQRQIIDLPDKKIAELKQSVTAEGVYIFRHDSSYRIAVVKDSSPLHDYIGVIIDSRLPGWKKGMLKFEGKKVHDSLLKGVLYMRNQMPKEEWFFLGNNYIGGDWQREGTARENRVYTDESVSSKKISGKTLYIKISSFYPSNAKNIDSVFKANAEALKTMPYLVLDLRDNGGGSDFAYAPILPYIYTGPVATTGVDVLSTPQNINGWKKVLDDKDLPDANKKSINNIIHSMESNEGKFVNINEDYIDSSFKPLAYPSKIVILINNNCASTTEQFLLEAKQSSKVLLLGENTSGTLDYSNVREAAFSCIPYLLRYPTTRSRRLNVKQGIDNVGIKPGRYLNPKEDWIKAAVSILEH